MSHSYTWRYKILPKKLLRKNNSKNIKKIENIKSNQFKKLEH